MMAEQDQELKEESSPTNLMINLAKSVVKYLADQY